MASSLSLIFNTMFSSMFLEIYLMQSSFAVCLSRSDELCIYDQLIYEYYLNLICMIWYLCISLQIIGLVWPTRLVFLAMGEVLSFGFRSTCVISPSDIVGVAR